MGESAGPTQLIRARGICPVGSDNSVAAVTREFPPTMDPTGLTELVGTQPAQNVAVTRENRRDRMPGSCYYTTL